MTDDPLSLRSLDKRVRAVEDAKILADNLHATLVANDGSTARAVEKLTDALNDPRSGLIVELDRFRAEVVADRRAFRAWARGATAVVSIVFALFSVLAPWLRSLLEAAFGVSIPM